MIRKKISFLYDKLLSTETKLKFEHFIFIVAIVTFLGHLAIIGLLNLGIIDASNYPESSKNPIRAIYTPFSIILFYEIYCLIYFLPKSMSIHMGKQFEIVTLIAIRGMFNDLSKLDITSDVSSVIAEPQYLYSMVTVIILFGLIFIFYRLNQSTIKRINECGLQVPEKNLKYFYAKKLLAVIVGIVFFGMFIYSFFQWITGDYSSVIGLIELSQNQSKYFFDYFFIILILSDVFILLLSFRIMDDFHKVIRNSGYVISTIILLLSFSVKGLSNQILIVIGVLFGTVILAIYKLYEKTELPKDI